MGVSGKEGMSGRGGSGIDMARGGHGLSKNSPRLAMSYPSMPFRGGLPTGQVHCSRLLPLWTTHAVRLWRRMRTLELEAAPSPGDTRRSFLYWPLDASTFRLSG
jgi:hypothetical protein